MECGGAITAAVSLIQRYLLAAHVHNGAGVTLIAYDRLHHMQSAAVAL